MRLLSRVKPVSSPFKKHPVPGTGPTTLLIISFRNMLGLNSVERGNSFWEFLYLKNLPVSGSFYVFDLIWSRIGFETSNQVVFAQRMR
jgi:hypothetical protein